MKNFIIVFRQAKTTHAHIIKAYTRDDAIAHVNGNIILCETIKVNKLKNI